MWDIVTDIFFMRKLAQTTTVLKKTELSDHRFAWHALYWHHKLSVFPDTSLRSIRLRCYSSSQTTIQNTILFHIVKVIIVASEQQGEKT